MRAPVQPRQSEFEGYITVQEYARRVGKTPIAIYKRIQRGKLKAVNVGGVLLVDGGGNTSSTNTKKLQQALQLCLDLLLNETVNELSGTDLDGFLEELIVLLQDGIMEVRET